MSDRKSKNKIIISGGGTGGHIYPAIAIAQEFIRRHPDRTVGYIGKTGGREEKIVEKSGLPIQFFGISAQGLTRRISPAIFTTIYRTMIGFMQAMRIIKENRPEVVIGTGGYVSATAVFSAQLCGIPTLIHEQNAFPGLTNRILGKKAKMIATSYEELEKYFSKDKIRITGNPVREEFLNLDREKSLKEFGLSPNFPTLLIFGGSQGARAINQSAIEAFEILNKQNLRFQVIFQTGETGYSEILNRSQKLTSLKMIVKPYLFDIQNAYAVADLVICRSGAISISELTVCGLPAILIPYPFATNNHQEKNARAVEKKGAAVVILEKELNAQKLANEILRILNSEQIKKEMSSNSKGMAKPNAAKDICDWIESLMS